MGERNAAARAGVMHRTVEEVLEGIAAPDMSAVVLREALAIARLDRVPEDPDEARRFVEGALRIAVEAVVDAEAADSVSQSLAPMLGIAEDHARARRREDDTEPFVTEDTGVRRTSPPPLAAVPNARVVLATLDQTGAQRIRRALAPVPVETIRDAIELLMVLDAAPTVPVCLVVDCVVPAVDPMTVATMQAHFPAGSRIVLWGASEDVRATLARVTPHSAAWVTLDGSASHGDVARLVGAIRGDPTAAG